MLPLHKINHSFLEQAVKDIECTCTSCKELAKLETQREASTL